MNFERMLLSGTFLIPLAVGIVVSIVLTFFPLVGTLGFEYSVIMGFVLAASVAGPTCSRPAIPIRSSR